MIQLGDFVQDEVTGFRGIALARTECLYEATCVRVQPRSCNEDSKQPAAFQWIEEDRLMVVKEREVVGFVQVAGKSMRTAALEKEVR